MKAYRSFFLLAGLLASLALLAAGCLPSHRGGGVAEEPAFCETNPEQCGPIMVNLPDGYWSSGMHPLDARFVPMTLPDPAATSHFRVVAFNGATGASMAAGPCTQGCVDIPAGTTSGTITVPTGATYDVCDVAIGPQSPVSGTKPTLTAGGCAMGVEVGGTANIVNTLGALAVTVGAPSPGPNYAYTEPVLVTFVSTGMPVNLSSFSAFQVDGDPSGSLNRSLGSLCTNTVITPTVSTCLTDPLGIPGTTAPTQFYVLVTVDASKYAVDWGSGATLWTDAQDALGQAVVNELHALSVAQTVDPAPTGPINIIVSKSETNQF